MRLGYPCINRGIGCSAGRTFRLAGYSRSRLAARVTENLACLRRILVFNRERGLLFFRISSDTVPFASHPVCDLDWVEEFAAELGELGGLVRSAGMRISMHPDQFVIINALRAEVVAASVRELEYHARLLDAMELGEDARIQIHIGGVYGDRNEALARFIREYSRLPRAVRRRLAVENDDRRFSLADCLRVHEETGVPVILDTLHHEILNHGENLRPAMEAAAATWTEASGPFMMDFSLQYPGGRRGRHAEHLEERQFLSFLDEAEGLDFDLMLEIKDKEASALKALDLARSRGRM